MESSKNAAYVQNINCFLAHCCCIFTLLNAFPKPKINRILYTAILKLVDFWKVPQTDRNARWYL